MSSGKHSSTSNSGRQRESSPSRAKADLPLGKKLIFSAIATVLAFGILEGALALFQVRPELYERDPYVGFTSEQPLFVEDRSPDGQISFVTAKNRLAFFNPQRFPKTKEAGVFRIFSLGGSTAYGHPYTDPTSFNGWLREFLRAVAPDRRWEAINAGGISYGSYREARLMEELIRYEPDLFIIYTGHNEFLEKRIYSEIIKMPAPLRGLTGFAMRLRSASLVKRGIEAITHSVAPATKLETDPVTLLDNSLGPTAFTRDEKLHEQILRHYEFNIARMVDIARSIGAKIIFVTPVSNLREASPFKSEHRQGLSEEDRRHWLQLYNQARQEASGASPTNALATLAEAAAIDDRPADLHFVRGRVLEKLGQFKEAKAAYERARDEDVCPLRAPGAIRKILTQVAANRQAPLIDFESFVESHSEHGIPGGNLFLDHVHLTVDGYRLLALEILKAMEKEGWVRPNWDPTIITRVTQEVTRRIDRKAHSLALMNLCKTLGWAGKREEAYRAGSRAVELDPNLAEVQYQAGLAAQLSGRIEEAVVNYRKAVELKPDHADAHCALGVVLEDRGQLQEAIRHYTLALQYGKPKDAERDRKNLATATAKLRQQNGRL